MIQFECPTCGARHQRGFVDGVDTFRCLHCGYLGHGFHSNEGIDREAKRDHDTGNEFNRAHGLPEVPLGVDPLNGAGASA